MKVAASPFRAICEPGGAGKRRRRASSTYAETRPQTGAQHDCARSGLSPTRRTRFCTLVIIGSALSRRAEEDDIPMSALPSRVSEPGAYDPLGVRYPNTARIWNYHLRGKDNFDADRQAGEAVNILFREMGVPSAGDAAVEPVTSCSGWWTTCSDRRPPVP